MQEYPIAYANGVHRRKRVFEMTRGRDVQRKPPGRRDQAHGRRRHGVRERPARRGAGEHQLVHALGVPDSKILRDYSAEARAEDVHGAGPDVIKDGEPSPTMACTLTEPVG